MTVYSTTSEARRGQQGADNVRGEAYQLDAACNGGIIVCQGAGNETVKAPASAAEVAAAVGGLLYNPAQYKAAGQTTDFAAADMGEILSEGLIYLHSETAMTRGAQPYVRYASGAGGTELGCLRNAAVTSETALLPNAVVQKTTSVAGPVLVKLNLPYRAAS